MDPYEARLIAERLHARDREEDGTSLLRHIGSVARSVPADARSGAWLHEALGWTQVAEQELLEHGLTAEELRALRLLHCTHVARTNGAYLAYMDLIARAAGASGRIARVIMIADLEDRRLHPRVHPGGWSPPYSRGLDLLRRSPSIGHRTAIAATP